MAKTQQQYLEEYAAPMKKRAEELYAGRTAADAQQVEQINGIIDRATKASTAQYQQQIDALPQQSRPLYDANALDEAVGRARVQEYLGNMGMTDSGLSGSMATALQVQKGKADRQVRMNEQQQRQKLMATIDQIISENENKKAEQEMNIHAATRDWYDEINARIEETASTNAATAYAADQDYEARVKEAEATRYKADMDKQAALEAAEIKAQRDYDTKVALALLDAELDAAADERNLNAQLALAQQKAALSSAANTVTAQDEYDAQRRKYVQSQMENGATYEQSLANGYAVYPSQDPAINAYYEMIRNGYTAQEVQAYFNAGGGEAGAEAMEALAYSKAELLLKSMNMDITKFFGKTFWHNKENDGRLVKESIEQQFKNNSLYASMSKTEKEIAAAAAIGQMVATSWHQHSDSEENETRLKVACNLMGVNPTMATLYYNKYKNNTPDLRHI